MSMGSRAPAGTILHVPYTYFPDPSGGTEVYVRNLAQGLARLGYFSSIAAPGTKSAKYEHEGVQVYRFQSDPRPRLDLAYGVPDGVAAENFRTILDELRPGIVHLHARTAAVSERICDLAHDAGARVVFTYHTPTVSCARGTMMLYGNEPCDGVVERRRCTSCALAAHGVPIVLSALSASIPDRLASSAASLSKLGRPAAALRISALIGQTHDRFRSFMAKVDHLVAVCQWVRDVLARNGVPDGKLTVSRHGIPENRPVSGQASARGQRGPLKLSYFGRIDRPKGPDLLVRAVAAIPNANVTLDLFAIFQADNGISRKRVQDWLARDARLQLRGGVVPDEVRQVMADYDLIAIPSRCLETGPLVALEAFAAGVPVLGANLGGIAESVRNGVDGVLVRPDDVGAWADAISMLADNRRRVDELRENIRPPRTMSQVADDMAGIYTKLRPRR